METEENTSLRDKLASDAMQVYLKFNLEFCSPNHSYRWVAEQSYRLADVMLEVRNETN